MQTVFFRHQVAAPLEVVLSLKHLCVPRLTDSRHWSSGSSVPDNVMESWYQQSVIQLLLTGTHICNLCHAHFGWKEMCLEYFAFA